VLALSVVLPPWQNGAGLVGVIAAVGSGFIFITVGVLDVALQDVLQMLTVTV
jgi:hypothetical protein